MSVQRPTNRPLTRSLIVRYLVLAGAFLALSLTLYGLFQVYSTNQQQTNDLENKIAIQTHFLAEVSSEHILINNFFVLERLMRETNADPDVVYSIILHTDGRQLTRYVDREDPIIAEALALGSVDSTLELFERAQANPNVREQQHPIESEGVVLGEVRLGYSIEGVQQRVFTAGLTIFIATLILIGTLSALTFFLFNWLVGRPLLEVSELAQALAAGELDTRAEVKRPDEIGQLKIVFNQMAAQLQTTLEGARQSQQAAEAANVALRIREAESRQLSHVASRTSNMVVITDALGNIEWVNDAFVQLTEYTLEEVIGKRPGALLQGEESDPDVVAYMSEQLNQQKGFSSELLNYSKSGRPYWVNIDVQPVNDEDGNLTNFIAVESDITERKSTEAALRQAKDAALAADRAKSEFLANMSHEIRTPLNGIIGMTSLLMETDLTPPQRDNMDIIRRSGDTLLVIINDILDFSKIEADQLDIEASPFNLRQCVEDALALLSAQAGDKRLDLAYDIAPHLPTTVVGDVTRVRQVLSNLISNAVKFTEKGEVVVLVKGHFIENGGLRLAFAVRDTGIGIRAQDAERLFQAFSQVDASTTRQYGGTGLGLAICRRLCELMGGTIWIESELGNGSTFHFDIVVGVAEQQPNAPIWSSKDTLLQGKHLLIVDDNRTNRHLLARYLEHWGGTVTAVESGADALSYVEAGEQRADAAILDVHMPLMDGYSLAKRLHQKLPELPIIIFSSSGNSTPPKTVHNIAAYLAKPLKPASLFQIFQELFHKSSQQAGTPAVTQPPKHDAEMSKKHPLKILVAEDNRINQLVMKRLLGRVGYQADMVANGLEVLDAVQGTAYDLIFMDVQMPEMDGVAATQHLKRTLSAETCPYIVALTANALDGDRERYLAAGMDSYISKPVSIHGLVASLYDVISHLAAPASTNRWAEWVDMIHFETQFGESASDALDELIPLFISDAVQQVDSLHTAFEKQDLDEVSRIAHSLHGASGNVGLIQLSAAFRKIDRAAARQHHSIIATQLEYATQILTSLQQQL